VRKSSPTGTPQVLGQVHEDPLGQISNAIRLSLRETVVGIGILAGLSWLVPTAWEHVERFEPGPDYRIPYNLGTDYWFYGRYCRVAASRSKVLVVGDSVIWGQYVRKDQTLSHHLNVQAGRVDHFANLGLDGSHPLALAGLLEHYAGAITGCDVLLHCNPLWMTSPKHDLQTDKEFQFNHPRLVPQFRPRIPCYTASWSERVGIVIERHLPLFSWASHVQLVYFNGMSLANWTMEHPYRNPLRAVTLEVPSSDKAPESEQLPWFQRGIDKSDFPWVEPGTSRQWDAFQRCVSVLRRRGNRVFVVIGPFNEHMLVGKSAETYGRIKGEMQAWLVREGIPHFLPPILPRPLYADASHPLSAGYERLAEQLHQDEAFRKFEGR